MTEKRAPLKSYRELDVWQKSVDLVEQTYVLTRRFPDEERFGLISQLRRAAVSVPANIAEGYGRKHRAEYAHHVSMARGSFFEWETHMVIAMRLGYATEGQVVQLRQVAQDVGKMLNRLIAALDDNASRTEASPESRFPNPAT
jgi:four helix bundle protein